MTTVNDLILDAALEARIIDSGADSWQASRSAHALRILNRMLGTWANNNFLLHEQKEEDLAFIGGQEEYSIGTSGSPDFNTTRPQIILDGTFITDTTGSIDYPMRIKTLEEYNLIRLKETQGRPRWIAYNLTFPNGTLKVWYTPDGLWNLHLVSLKEIASFAATDETVSLPPGYEDLIVQSLGARLSVSYGKDIRPDLILLAKEAYDSIMIRNLANRTSPTILDLGVMFGGQPYTDINSGPFDNAI